MDSESIKIEFSIQTRKNESDLEDIRKSLENFGKVVELTSDGRLILETTKPWIEVQNSIESSGRRAVLTGSGGVSAVAICDKGNDEKIKGVVRFCANSKTDTGSVVDGVLDGLNCNQNYKLSVHEFGDVSCSCETLGDTYKDRSYDLTSDDSGRAVFRFHDKTLSSVQDLIGRSVLVSKEEKRLSCGIIARSAGIFENFKKICACDGVKIWDERDRPLTGPGRRVT